MMICGVKDAVLVVMKRDYETGYYIIMGKKRMQQLRCW